MNDAQLDVFHFEFLTPLKWETSGPEKKIMEVLWTHFVVGWWSSNFVQRCPGCPSRLPSNFTRKQLSKNVLRRMLRSRLARYRHKTNVNSHYIPSMLGPNNMRHSGNNSSAPRLLNRNLILKRYSSLSTVWCQRLRVLLKKNNWETRNIYMFRTNWFAQIVHKIHQWSNTSDKALESHQGVFSSAPSFSLQWFMTFMEPNHANES